MSNLPLHRDLLPWHRSRFWLAFMAGSAVYLGTFLVVSSASPEIDAPVAQLLPLGLGIVAALAVGFGPLLSSWLVARLWAAEVDTALQAGKGGAAVSEPPQDEKPRLRFAARLLGAPKPALAPPPKAVPAEPAAMPAPSAPASAPSPVMELPRPVPPPAAVPAAPVAPAPTPLPRPFEPSLASRSLTREELAATEEVLRRATGAPERAAGPRTASPMFHCLQCGAEMEPGQSRCPSCGVRYLPEEAAAEEPLNADEEALLDLLDAQLAVHKERSPIIYFDVEAGRISYLDETIEPHVELAFECDSCGAVVEGDLPRCPNCGAVFEGEGTGILELVADLEFTEAPDELLCPFCGSKTPFANLNCLACGKSLEDPRNRALLHLVPLVEGPGIIFVHLDVETGRVSYLQRGAGVQGRVYQEQTIQLDRIGRETFEERWKGLGRV